MSDPPKPSDPKSASRKCVFVKLLGEDVDVWRPVAAVHIANDTYELVDQPYDRETETWQFEPGELIVCKPIEVSEGLILAAIRLGT